MSLGLLRPCLSCGEPTEGTRCEAHPPMHARTRERGSYRERGYTKQFDRLSKRAKELQPWCTDCGSTMNLQADHLPEAWHRHALGLTIRLTDVEVVCARCNTARGSSRPGSERYEEWEAGRV